MKTCPFCREEIHDEAVKCRYCCSRLSGELLDEAAGDCPREDRAESGRLCRRPGLDSLREILRRVLGIFITVGVCIWGFDVTKAAKEVHESSDQCEKFRPS